MLHRKILLLKEWKFCHQSSAQYKNKFHKVKNYLSERRKKVFITILNFNQLMKADQFGKI